MFTLGEIKERAKEVYALEITEEEADEIWSAVDRCVEHCDCCNATLNLEIETLKEEKEEV